MARRSLANSGRRRATSGREQKPATTRSAEVVLDIDVERDRVHLVLANCGDAVATTIRVEFSRPLHGPDGSSSIGTLPVFAELGVLRPGRELRIFWDAAQSLLGRRDDTSFVATVSWDERERPRQRAEYRHDLSIYRQWPTCVGPEPSAP